MCVRRTLRSKRSKDRRPQRRRPALQPLDRHNDAYLAMREQVRGQRVEQSRTISRAQWPPMHGKHTCMLTTTNPVTQDHAHSRTTQITYVESLVGVRFSQARAERIVHHSLMQCDHACVCDACGTDRRVRSALPLTGTRITWSTSPPSQPLLPPSELSGRRGTHRGKLRGSWRRRSRREPTTHR